MKTAFSALLLLLSTAVAFAQEIADLVELTDDAVFKILTYDDWGLPSGTGTGFFTSESGKAITNWHVLNESTYAFAMEQDGTIYEIVEVTRACVACDLAEIQVQLPSDAQHPHLQIDQGDSRKGESIFIIGCPKGYQNFVSKGVVSAFTEIDGEAMIQTEASISGGSSGSPIMNMEGKVIGVVTSNYADGQNLNFGTPSSNLTRLSEDFPATTLTGGDKDLWVFHERCSSEPNLMIHTIECLKEKTTVRMSFANTSLLWGDGAYIYTSTDDPETSFYIQDQNTGVKLNILSATLGESPQDPTIMQLGETVLFEIVFPPLSNRNSVFTISEGMLGGDWTFENLDLASKEKGMSIQRKQDVDALDRLWRLILTEYDLMNFDFAERFQHMERVMKGMDLSAFEHNLMGVISYLYGNEGDAEWYFEQAIQDAPLYAQPWVSLYVMTPDDDYAQQLEYIEGALRASPDSPEYHELRGDVYYVLGEYEKSYQDKVFYMESDRTLTYNHLMGLGFCGLQLGMPEACQNLLDGLEWYAQITEDADFEYIGDVLNFIEENCGKKFLKENGY